MPIGMFMCSTNNIVRLSATVLSLMFGLNACSGGGSSPSAAPSLPTIVTKPSTPVTTATATPVATAAPVAATLAPFGCLSSTPQSDVRAEYARRRFSSTGQPVPLPQALNILWRARVSRPNGLGYFTTSSSAEESAASATDGQIAYVPQSSSSQPNLTRYVSSSTNDDLDASATPTQSGYTPSEVLGSAQSWSSTTNGLTALNEYLTNGYHAIGNATNLPSNGKSPTALGYGYPRYGNSIISLSSITGGGVQLDSNLAAGGAVWGWTWNGVQFIDTLDLGREMQSALFYSDASGNAFNPTEAGDGAAGDQCKSPALSHGSPLLAVSNSGSTQTTQADPLDFTLGANGDHPDVYPGMALGKTVTLNYRGLGPVAEYQTNLNLPSGTGPADLEQPTVYLTSRFMRYYTYDAGTQALTEVTSQIVPCSAKAWIYPQTGQQFSGVGGVIATDATGAYAMGEYAGTVPSGGTANIFALYNFINCGGTSKLDVVAVNSFPAGASSYRSWVASGSLSQVVQEMATLYAAGDR